MSSGLDDRTRTELARACRIMAQHGLVEDILGHISSRRGDLVACRCRGPNENGLRFTGPDDIRLVDPASGSVLDDPTGSYRPPNELPIHTAVLAARPDLSNVVHAHPPAVVAASLAGIDLTPIYGAYDIPGAHLAAAGIPVHPSPVLIVDEDRAEAMVASMADADVVVLRGHGLVTAGRSVAAAVLLALQVDRLARMHLRVRAAGAVPRELSADELAGLPDLGPGFNETVLWRHLQARLAASEGDRPPGSMSPEEGG